MSVFRMTGQYLFIRFFITYQIYGPNTEWGAGGAGKAGRAIILGPRTAQHPKPNSFAFLALTKLSLVCGGISQ